MSKRLGVGILLLVAIGGVVIWVRREPERTTATGAGAGVTAGGSEGALRDAPVPPGRGSIVDRARADKMRDEIRRLLAEAGPASAPAPTAAPWNGPVSATGRPLAPMPAPAGGSGGGGPDPFATYIRDRMREDFIPLGRKCYEDELLKDPKLAGRAVVKFHIVGDARVGGVVERAELDPKKSTAFSPSFVQCLSESMMSVSFGAPPEGHEDTTVAAPFEFSPDEPDAAPPR